MHNSIKAPTIHNNPSTRHLWYAIFILYRCWILPWHKIHHYFSQGTSQMAVLWIFRSRKFQPSKEEKKTLPLQNNGNRGNMNFALEISTEQSMNSRYRHLGQYWIKSIPSFIINKLKILTRLKLFPSYLPNFCRETRKYNERLAAYIPSPSPS